MTQKGVDEIGRFTDRTDRVEGTWTQKSLSREHDSLFKNLKLNEASFNVGEERELSTF